jgi:hypothetical protein
MAAMLEVRDSTVAIVVSLTKTQGPIVADMDTLTSMRGLMAVAVDTLMLVARVHSRSTDHQEREPIGLKII